MGFEVAGAGAPVPPRFPNILWTDDAGGVLKNEDPALLIAVVVGVVPVAAPATEAPGAVDEGTPGAGDAAFPKILDVDVGNVLVVVPPNKLGTVPGALVDGAPVVGVVGFPNKPPDDVGLLKKLAPLPVFPKRPGELPPVFKEKEGAVLDVPVPAFPAVVPKIPLPKGLGWLFCWGALIAAAVEMSWPKLLGEDMQLAADPLRVLATISSHP